MNKKILLIEDDQVFAHAYRNKLLVDGFEVEIASDGEAGLEKIHGFRPDAILLDLMLPKLPGVEIIKQIRTEPEFQQLPLIVFTNTYLTSTVQDAWKAGATQCLSKADCSPKEVIRTIRTALGLNGGESLAGPPADAADRTEPGEDAAPRRDLDEAPHAPADADEEFQSELRKTFAEGLPASLAALRGLLQGLVKAEQEPLRLQQLQQMHRRLRGLTSNATLVGLWHVAQMTDALEALLKELHEKPKNVNVSTLRTVASAIDFLGLLFEEKVATRGRQPLEALVLVVDDEAISRRAIAYALEKARLQSVVVEDPFTALELLGHRTFDLIFLDVDMPTMNGFELCSKVRALPEYRKTPVVFVTSLNDLESRATSSMSGGNDFIAKPFLFIEMAVKALVYVLRGRIEAARH